MDTYLNENLKFEIKKIFEPRYGRKIKNDEVLEIADNLTRVVEEILKFRWKQKYENQ